MILYGRVSFLRNAWVNDPFSAANFWGLICTLQFVSSISIRSVLAMKNKYQKEEEKKIYDLLN